MVRRGFLYPSSDQEFAIRTEILFWPTNTILPHLAFNQDCDDEFGVLHHEFGQFVVGQFCIPYEKYDSSRKCFTFNVFCGNFYKYDGAHPSPR